jgi:Zn-dependent protease with chaperone function
MFQLIGMPLMLLGGAMFVTALFAIVVGFLFVRMRGLSAQAKLLYLATLALELPGAVVRFFVFGFLAPVLLAPVWTLGFLIFSLVTALTWIGYRIASETPPMTVLAGLAGMGGVLLMIAGTLVALVAFWGGFWPLITSILSLLGILKGGQRYHRWSTGARTIGTERELPIVLTALAALEAKAGKLTKPDYFFVLDTDSAEAYTVGNAMYLTRGLIHRQGHPEPHLTAMLAHQLGHANSTDARVVLALRRLTITPMYVLSTTLGQLAPGIVTFAARVTQSDMYVASVISWLINLCLAASGGGLGLLLLNIPWNWYWRQRDFAADEYAAQLGQARPLVEYLDKHQGFDVATPYYIAPQPYTELRIDRLLQRLKAPQPTKPDTQKLVLNP